MFLRIPRRLAPGAEDISLTLPPGAVVAIVGENGAGKTTLVKLLTKMYEPTSGAILIDGIPLSPILATDWRGRSIHRAA
jgi:ATP-binding cassette subfamily B protein